MSPPKHMSPDLSVSLCAGAIDDSMLLMLFWILTGLSILGLFSKQYGLQPLTLALILRSIYHLGIGNTLILLGSLNVRTVLIQSNPVLVSFEFRFMSRSAAVPAVLVLTDRADM